MAASIKRKVEDNSETPGKRFREEPDEKLNAFLKWCEEHNFSLSSKVKVSRAGSCAQYGMVATDNIAEGYCLFQVPRSCILMPKTCGISKVIEEELLQLSSTNQWIPLLLALLHETNKPKSMWRPYLDLVPDFQALDLPMFWPDEEVERLLTSTGVDRAVERDLDKIENDFNKLVLPFFQRHSSEIKNDAGDLQSFKKIVAFVMSYSFTEPPSKLKDKGAAAEEENDDDDEDDDEDEGDDEDNIMSPPMMVPMADMLNHVTKHNAKLTFGSEALKMVTTRPIEKGEEIFNTYGQVSNLHLMHMYGFAEQYPENFNDVVEIPSERLLEAAKAELEAKDEAAWSHLEKKWQFLEEQDVLTEDEVFVLSKDGIINDEICVQTLKVLSMTDSEFSNHVEKEGWSDAESEESESSLSGDSKLEFERIPGISDKWKSLLKRMAEAHLQHYPSTLEEDEKRLATATELPPRERFALYTAHGQKALLGTLIQTCSTPVVQ